jgi:hypothetical protein
MGDVGWKFMLLELESSGGLIYFDWVKCPHAESNVFVEPRLHDEDTKTQGAKSNNFRKKLITIFLSLTKLYLDCLSIPRHLTKEKL